MKGKLKGFTPLDEAQVYHPPPPFLVDGPDLLLPGFLNFFLP